MPKKDFSKVNTRSVYTVEDAIQETTAAPAPAELPRRSRSTEPGEAEIQAARAQGKTRGRKGVKMLRINMAFSPEVYDYIKTMSQYSGMTITDFTELVFQKSLEKNAALYEQAKGFRQSIE